MSLFVGLFSGFAGSHRPVWAHMTSVRAQEGSELSGITSQKGTNSLGLRLKLTASFRLNNSLRCPVCKYSHTGD